MKQKATNQPKKKTKKKPNPLKLHLATLKKSAWLSLKRENHYNNLFSCQNHPDSHSFSGYIICLLLNQNM